MWDVLSGLDRVTSMKILIRRSHQERFEDRLGQGHRPLSSPSLFLRVSPPVSSRHLSRQGLALFSQGFKNSPEIADASAGNRLWIRTEVEDLYRNIALIPIFC